MIIKCAKCVPVEGIEIPSFTSFEKENIIKIASHSAISAVKFIVDNFSLSHLVSKYIVSHLNLKYGICKRCSNSNLFEENIECEQCGTLNLNWRIN